MPARWQSPRSAPERLPAAPPRPGATPLRLDDDRTARHPVGGASRPARVRGWARGRRRPLVLLVLALGLAYAGLVAADLVRIQRDLDAGQGAIAGLDLATVDADGGLAAVVDRAADRLEAAEDRARSSPWLSVLAPVPVVGDQVETVRDLTGIAAGLGRDGRQAAERLEVALDAGGGGVGRVRLAEVATEVLDDLRVQVEAVTVPDRGPLLPPLAAARADVEGQLLEARLDLERGVRLATGLRSFLDGPRRYLILGGNNAEMRSVAIPTTSGIATVGGGSIAVGEFSEATCCDAQGVELTFPGVAVPEAYTEVHGFLNGAQGYRTTVTSANWPLTAEIMADITERNVYGPVDGIIYVDTVTLANLLGVIGPVTVDGVEYRNDNVLEELLYRNYLRFDDPAVTDARRDAQSRVARTVFDALETRDYSVTELAGVLSDLARSRHLQAWAEDPAENDLWEAFGANRELGPDDLLVTTQELGASKLDWFTTTAVDVEVEDQDDHHQVTLGITLANPEHGETTAYIDGGGIYADPGEWGAWLLTYLPADAYDIVNLDPGFTTAGTDGPATVVGMIVRVPEGETLDIEISFKVPKGRRPLHVLPAARVNGSLWTYDGEAVSDVLPFDLDLNDRRIVADPRLYVTLPDNE